MTTTKGPFGFTDDDVEPTAEELDAVADHAAKRSARLEQVARDLEKAIKDLARWDRFTKENAGGEEVWEQVQRRRKEDLKRKAQLQQEFKTLFDGDKNLPMVRPTLASTLDEIVGQLNRFFLFDNEADAQSVALWIINSHVFLLQRFEHTPFLIVHSKQPGSGKTYLAQFIQKLSPNPQITSSVTGSRVEAFLQREAKRRDDPILQKYWDDNGLLGLGLNTLLFDEADRYTSTGLLMRVLHAAHHKEGTFWAADGSPVPCFAPIGVFRLNDPRHDPELRAFVSRSILLEMHRRDPFNPDHKRDLWCEENRRKLPLLIQQLSFLVQESKAKFKKWRPERDLLANMLHRHADTWRPLIGIADTAGERWPEIARKIAMTPPPKPEAPVFVHAGRPIFLSGREKSKARILGYLNAQGGRCTKTDLYAKLFSRNLPSAELTACIAELVAHKLITTHKEPPTGPGGRYTE